MFHVVLKKNPSKLDFLFPPKVFPNLFASKILRRRPFFISNTRFYNLHFMAATFLIRLFIQISRKHFCFIAWSGLSRSTAPYVILFNEWKTSFTKFRVYGMVWLFQISESIRLVQTLCSNVPSRKLYTVNTFKGFFNEDTASNRFRVLNNYRNISCQLAENRVASLCYAGELILTKKRFELVNYELSKDGCLRYLNRKFVVIGSLRNFNPNFWK